MTLKKLQLKGLRSLEDTGEIVLKPITILLGQNSSGKSTYLRSLPLIKQSLESKNNEPLLWYGSLVDFGSYDESICATNKERGIQLKLEIEKPPSHSEFSKINADKISIEIKIDKSTSQLQQGDELLPSQSVTTNLTLGILDSNISLEFSKKTSELLLVSINGEDFTEHVNKNYLLIGREHLIPRLVDRPIANIPDPNDSRQIEAKPVLSYAMTSLSNFIDEIRNTKSSLKSVPSHRLIDIFPLRSDKETLATLNNLRQNQELFKNIISTWTTSSPKFKEFKNLIIASRLGDIIDFSKQVLNDEFASFSYISPIRASAQRYYRQQAATDNLDPKGENFAHFLKNLRGTNESSFKKWLSEKLGVSIAIKQSYGHISIYLTDANDTSKKVNLADTGFGYSQLLPIAALIWQTKNPNQSDALPSSSIRTIAIEQPELHLHPRIQSKIADLLVLDQTSEYPATILIETHSEPLVNRIGELIESGKIRKEDVAIILFDKENFDESTKISHTEFDSNGYLTNWPIGFFNSK